MIKETKGTPSNWLQTTLFSGGGGYLLLALGDDVGEGGVDVEALNGADDAAYGEARHGLLKEVTGASAEDKRSESPECVGPVR